MKPRTINLAIFLAATIFASSCDRPEYENSHYILEQFKFDSKEYKDELAK